MVAIQTTMDQEEQDLVDPNACQNNSAFEILDVKKNELCHCLFKIKLRL